MKTSRHHRTFRRSVNECIGPHARLSWLFSLTLSTPSSDLFLPGVRSQRTYMFDSPNAKKRRSPGASDAVIVRSFAFHWVYPPWLHTLKLSRGSVASFESQEAHASYADQKVEILRCHKCTPSSHRLERYPG